MRVLFVTTGPDSEPSSRFRVFQFLERLISLLGIPVVYDFDDAIHP